MPRPSQDSERKLIDAGRSLLEEAGFSGLSVRAVAAKAGVNLGLVSYHFGGKEAFVRRVAQEVYEEFFKGFSLEVAGEKDARKALRGALLTLARFMRDHRGLVAGVIRDMSDGHPEALAFARSNGPRHARIIIGLLKRCMAEGSLKRRPMLRALPFVMGAVVLPSLMAGPLVKVAPKLPFGITRKLVEQNVLSDAALAERVDMALHALEL